ncbi:PilT/PilU family type 4a pilus ATPase [Ruminococcaceae bacterium OttesenSCG-928-A16]|nr:PilT/PilU family type 4a pilus ATPase [Ruminococcaceae bacterium OttesenSCG-928-A16]
MELQALLQRAVELSASDLFLIAGSPPAHRKDSVVVTDGEEPLAVTEVERLVREIYALTNNRPIERLLERGEDDFSFSLPGVGRFRANAFRQRGSLAAVVRVVMFNLPNFQNLSIPSCVMDLTEYTKGLVLITGPAGSGKSTTLACLVDKINEERANHIITMEDPIEFIHRHKQSIVTQREINNDTHTYASALRAGLRQSPDVILVGEMRDLDTIEIAMTAAETGQLVLSTLHTMGAANTINRILDIFPPGQQQQIRVQLSMVLQAVVSQQLVPSVEGPLLPVFEIMLPNPAIRNMIRENNIHQINSAIYAGMASGMVTMDQSILNLYNAGKITADTALKHCVNLNEMQKKIEGQ